MTTEKLRQDLTDFLNDTLKDYPGLVDVSLITTSGKMELILIFATPGKKQSYKEVYRKLHPYPPNLTELDKIKADVIKAILNNIKGDVMEAGVKDDKKKKKTKKTKKK